MTGRRRLVGIAGLVALGTVLAVNILVAGTLVAYQQIRNRELIDASRMYQVARLGGGEAAPDPAGGDDEAVVLLVRPDGAVAERLGVRAAGFPVPGPAALRVAAADGEHRFFGRFYGVVDRVGGGAFVITARALGGQIAVAARLAGVLLAVDAAVCVLAAGFAAVLFRRASPPPGPGARPSEPDDRQRRFVSDAGHELRTPLTVIIGYAQLLRLGVLADRAAREHALGEVEREARRLTALADHLLLLARIDEGRPEHPGPVELDALCREVVEASRAAHPGHPVRYRCEGEPPVVAGAEPWLREAVSCLLANVGGHTPAGTRAEVVLRTEGTDAVLDVVDDGPGIAEADRLRVFERFFRCDEARQRRPGDRGAGLGLSIVHSVVTACAGTVVVRPGERGTWIRVRLPAERRETSADRTLK
ncbi:sensor histidine kinase [Amycolatopsis tolypomycina]|uniref:histidine kinase n=1 Tax=Amycolatopsis tolypomycina TaxID=208445 RepID=A0A1H4T1L3_9PSEU|nr:HAMP domain-containing sensor histidine kinase [Amycolatopsis tolypomycina]SEC50355.1 two-component system, OmpR family, sensor kinase [Amycolatopsis tolypomycina]